MIDEVKKEKDRTRVFGLPRMWFLVLIFVGSLVGLLFGAWFVTLDYNKRRVLSVEKELAAAGHKVGVESVLAEPKVLDLEPIRQWRDWTNVTTHAPDVDAVDGLEYLVSSKDEMFVHAVLGKGDWHPDVLAALELAAPLAADGRSLLLNHEFDRSMAAYYQLMQNEGTLKSDMLWECFVDNLLVDRFLAVDAQWRIFLEYDNRNHFKVLDRLVQGLDGLPFRLATYAPLLGQRGRGLLLPSNERL